MNYYEILEVSPNASPEVLRAAYKSLIQRYHPDRNPGNRQAAERSQAVVQAYQVLSDAGRRAAYDFELRRQSEIRNNLRSSTREAVPQASATAAPRSAHRLFWLVTAVIALSLWYAWPAAQKGQPVAGAAKDDMSLPAGAPPDAEQAPGGQAGRAPASRTIPHYVENLRVSLAAPGKPADATSANASYVLSIKSIGVVVGAFDGDKFVAFLERNKEYIGRRLAEKLAGADYELLVNGRERYLKRLILDSLGEITNTHRSEKSALPGAASAARYGAEAILLPDSFVVETHEANQLTVQMWTPK